MGWGVYDYPSPPEKEYVEIEGKVNVTYNIKIEVPKKWDNEMIIEDIEENINEYIQLADMTIEDIDI